MSGRNQVPPPPLWSGDPTELDEEYPVSGDVMSSASMSPDDSFDDDTIMMASPIGMLIGETLAGRYRIISALGEGGMGHVYECLDQETGEAGALKILNQHTEGGEFLKRFQREIQIISQIESPYVVGLRGAGSTRTGEPFLVEELLLGETLGQVIRRGPIEPARARRILDHVLRGLAAAHRIGVIHRDLKPDNIFLCGAGRADEVAKVLDFGFAMRVEEIDRRLTAVGTAVGTPKYMAPEQFLQGKVDGRADLYAAGVLFYRMLYGRAPFEDDDPAPDHVQKMAPPARLGWMHIYTPPPVAQNLPAGFKEIIARLLEKDPDRRFPDAMAVRRALADLDKPRQEAPIQERPTLDRMPTAGAPQPKKSRAKLYLGVLAVVSISLASAATWLLLTR